jgi:DNA-binding LytR/AlgR family response regulator
MVNIAICDDNEVFCSSLEKMLLEYTDYEIKVKTFLKSTSLCNHIKNHFNFDIIFLDIEFKNKDYNGIEVGDFIRNELKNQMVQIVYVSAKESYSMQLFDFRPMNFLVKPINQDKVFKVLDTYATLMDNPMCVKYFEFEYDFKTYRIPITDIMYLYSTGHRITIVTHRGKEYYLYGKLKNIKANELFKDFVTIHKSFLINLDYVLKYAYNEVQMQDNRILSISQSNRKMVHSKMVEKSF